MHPLVFPLTSRLAVGRLEKFATSRRRHGANPPKRPVGLKQARARVLTVRVLTDFRARLEEGSAPSMRDMLQLEGWAWDGDRRAEGAFTVDESTSNFFRAMHGMMMAERAIHTWPEFLVYKRESLDDDNIASQLEVSRMLSPLYAT
jgi:hypothetical protein